MHFVRTCTEVAGEWWRDLMSRTCHEQHLSDCGLLFPTAVQSVQFKRTRHPSVVARQPGVVAGFMVLAVLGFLYLGAEGFEDVRLQVFRVVGRVAGVLINSKGSLN